MTNARRFVSDVPMSTATKRERPGLPEYASGRNEAKSQELKWTRVPQAQRRSMRHRSIEEYARHNGHADLIRELVDGQVRC
jgi:hypothetical protein